MESAKTWTGIDSGRYYLIQTVLQFNDFITEAKKQKILALDTETSGLNWVFSDACGIVIGWGPSNNYYIPINHKCGNCCEGSACHEPQLDIIDVFESLQSLFSDESKTWLFWNAKYDLHVLRKLGFEVSGVVHDGLIIYFLLDENSDHSLKSAACLFIDKTADRWEKAVEAWRIEESRRRRGVLTTKINERIRVLKADLNYVSLLYENLNLSREAAIKNSDIKKSNNLAISRACREKAKQELENSFLAKYSNKEDITYDYLPFDVIVPYACADTHYTWVLINKFLPYVLRDAALKELYLNEIALLHVLFDTEHIGVKIDKQYLLDIGPKLETDIKQFQADVWQAIGHPFNIDSDDELIAALKEAGVQLTKQTKGTKEKLRNGENVEIKYSVDKEVLEGLAAKYKFASIVLNYRKACKLKSTYVDGILGKLDSNDFLHTTINQNVTTGRMSSQGPNLQNIPARDKRIKRAFIVPSDEFVYIFVDYSQIELRLTAHYSQDPALLSCYPFEGQERDVHSMTCAEVIMGMAYDDFLKLRKDETGHDKNNPLCPCHACVTKFKRDIAKRVNFGIIYGAGPYAIQRQVSTPDRFVSAEECEVYIEGYLRKYKGVDNWINLTLDELKRNLKVQNCFGRYRRFPDLPKQPNWLKKRNGRQAVNFLIQGSAADLFKYAITRVNKIIRGTGIRIINVVHDEIQFYWPKSQLHMLNRVKDEMEDFDFTVPIIAEFSFSKTDWSTKKELKG